MLETHSVWLMQYTGYVCNGRYKLCCVVWMVFAAELTFVTCSSVYLVHFCCCCLFVVQERIASVKREDSRTLWGSLWGSLLDLCRSSQILLDFPGFALGASKCQGCVFRTFAWGAQTLLLLLARAGKDTFLFSKN